MDGSAFGSGLFLQGAGSTLTFSPGAGRTQTVSDDIADQSGSGGLGAFAGTWDLAKDGAGTLILAGANTCSGATTVVAGVLHVTGSLASPVTVNPVPPLAAPGRSPALWTCSPAPPSPPASASAV